MYLGADVNKATANHDHTVLSLSCAGGHIGVVELLLKHGANVMQKLKVCVQFHQIVCCVLDLLEKICCVCTKHIVCFDLPMYLHCSLRLCMVTIL